jgi:glycosyltransferase involved in cell wall biosynthesis
LEKERSIKIAVNTRFLIKDKLEGIGWFSYNILKELVETHPEIEFYFIFDRPYDTQFIFAENVKPVIVSPPARHPLLWYVWFEIALPSALKKLNPDVFLSLDAYTSISANVKKVTVFHDIAFAFFDGHVPFLVEKFMRFFTPKYLKASNEIVTVSESSKKDLISHYQCDSSKIWVSCNASSEVYQPVDKDTKTLFQQQNTQGLPYFIFVGSIHPRKNVINLLKAFELFKKTDEKSMKLVIIGRFAWQFEAVKAYYNTMVFNEDVIFVNHLAQDALQKWVAAAEALIYVPFYEGFGIPLIEAMSCQIPIVCSNSSSMPEVTQNAAIHVSPHDINEIAIAMQEVLDENTKKMLIANGQEQIKKYTWAKGAEIVWKALTRAIEK